MSEDFIEPMDEPSKRQWLGYWSMIVQQTQNAFNDKAAQFILIPLGAAIGYSVESAAGLMIALPFVIFAPLAGWMSDRFSKRNVLIGAAIAQVLILALIAFAVWIKNMPLALLGFFLIAVQSAFFSPAKIGISKELVGSKRLGFASGIQQMLSMLALLVGQILSGWWFDHRYSSMGTTPENAWVAALFPLLLLTLFSLPAIGMAWVIPKVPALGKSPLTPKVLVSHFQDLRSLWSDSKLRQASMGVAFFWGFVAFLNLWSIKVAKALTEGEAGFGTLSSQFMAAASLGMVAGFAMASFLQKKRIELGWVPLAGVFMTLSGLCFVFLPFGGWSFLISLAFIAFFSALYLAPLNAWMQDRYPADQRGELQSAVNLQNCFAGIISVLFIELVGRFTEILGLSVWASFRIQILLIGLLCAGITFFIIRLMPAQFLRLVCTSIVKVVYRIQITGRENLPKNGAALLLPNHVTFADAFFLSVMSPRPLRFVMDETFQERRIIRYASKIFGTIPIQRAQPLEAIRIILSALEQGHFVVLFPEGQLTRSGALCELERGFEFIAKKAKCPVIPIWMSGAWGSIFSYERGKVFKKTPRHIPYGLTIAVGEPLPSRPNGAILQKSLLKAAAQAISHPFSKRSDADVFQNAYQLSQFEALPYGSRLHLFSPDLSEKLIHIFKRWAKLTRGQITLMTEYQASISGAIWIGAEQLRETLKERKNDPAEILFYDFGAHALESFVHQGVSHLPCLTLDGICVAMSMPHPQQSHRDPRIQAGHKTGSWGKILPGFYLEDGQILPLETCKGPSYSLDPESFLFPAS